MTKANTLRICGNEIQDGNRQGWQFGHMVNDAHSVYTRTTPGTGTLTVQFAKEDVKS